MASNKIEVQLVTVENGVMRHIQTILLPYPIKRKTLSLMAGM